MKPVKPPKKQPPSGPRPSLKFPPFTEKDTPQMDLGQIMARLITLATELTAPVPAGLTPAMQRALGAQKQEVEAALLGQTKLIEGFVIACGRAGVLSPEECTQAEESVMAIVENPAVVRMSSPETDAAPPETAPKAEEVKPDAPVVSIVAPSESPADGSAG